MRSILLPLLSVLLSTGVAQAAPFFQENTAKVPPPRCGGGADQGCYTSALVVADLDGDGKKDVIFANGGGYYEPGVAEPAVVWFNDGSSFSDGTETSFGGLLSRVRQVALGDVDGDGDLDVFLPGGYGLDQDRLLLQQSPRVFQEEAKERLPFGQKSRAGAAHLGDLDGDGDLDLVIGDWGDEPLSSQAEVRLLLNDGQGYFAAVKGRLPPALPAAQGSTPIDIDLHDVDGDLDLDILVNHRNGLSRLLLNDGKATFTEAPFPAKKGPYTYNTEACDIDGDGDLDLLLDNAAADLGDGHRTQVLINDGKGVFSDESEQRITGEPNTDDNIVKCADVDGDGDYDLIVGSLQNPSEKLLLNDGKGVFSTVLDAFPTTSDPTLGLDVADLDGDGLLDVVTGQGEGSPRLDRLFLGVAPSKPDTSSPRFRQIEAPPASILAAQTLRLRLAVTDAFTSEVGQHARVEIAYTTQDSSGTVPARFLGGDLFLAELGPFPGSTQLSLRPRATDPAGNTVEAPPFSVLVEGTGGAGGVGGSEIGGAAGAGTGGAGQAGSGPQAGAAGSVAGQGGAGAGGNGGSLSGGSGGSAALEGPVSSDGGCRWACSGKDLAARWRGHDRAVFSGEVWLYPECGVWSFSSTRLHRSKR
ncbi:MAG: VCBS repeat-containing protein [Polyangiaceae bacterium]|nr:VCBS repeat-containing protein [Polyangiaceae bacterium]